MSEIEVMLGFLVEFDPDATRAVMAAPGGPDGHPLGIATRELARDLLHLHMSLTGELAKHADGEVALAKFAEVHRLLAGIANLMGLLGVDFDPAALPSIRTRPQSTPLGHGGMCTADVVRALKDAEHALTYEEVVHAVFGHAHAQISVDHYRPLLWKIKGGLPWLGRTGPARGPTRHRAW
jgi:hypothetical protein